MKETVIKLYTETELNNKEIANKLGIEYKEVLNILKENKIPKKPTKSKGKKLNTRRELSEEEREKVKYLKSELYSNSQIAEILGIGSRTLDRIATENPELFKYPIRSYKKLAGKVKELIELYKEVKSINKVASYYKVESKTISKILKHNNIEIDKEENRKANTPHLSYGEPLREHWLYSTWSSIKTRCYNSNNKSYKNYGAKGITIYSKWKNDFNEFKKYVEKNLGKKDANLSLDRIDPLGNYEPGNIRWANKTTQAYNKSNCFKRDINNVDSNLILENKNLQIKFYSIQELQIQEEIKELKNSGVYIIKCISNNNYYIGSTSRSFRVRWKEIRKHCKNNKNKVSKYLRKFWNECKGEENFRFGVLEKVENNIKEREQYWIDKLEPSLNIVKIVN